MTRARCSGQIVRPPPGDPLTEDALTAPRAAREAPALQSLRSARRWLRLLSIAVPITLLPLLWASVRLNADVRAVHHTHENIDSIISARAAARQSREALHAYLQSGEPAQLATYKGAAEIAWREAWRFKEISFESPRQVSNVQRFEQRLGEMFKLGDMLLAEKNAGQPRSLEARVAAEEVINDGFRDAVGSLVDEERRLLASEEAALAISVRALQIFAPLFAAVVLLLGSIAWLSVDKLLAATPES